MNKKLLAAAIAGMFVAPVAFGAAHEGDGVKLSGILIVSHQLEGDTAAGAAQDSESLAHKARLMVTAKSGGMEGGLEYESAAGSSTTAGPDVVARQAYISYGASWGAVTIAQQKASGTYATTNGLVDIMDGASQFGSYYNQGSLSGKFVSYGTPELAPGLKAAVVLISSGDNDDEDFDAQVFGVTYANKDMGLSAAVWMTQYADTEATNDRTNIGVRYTGLPQADLRLSYEMRDDNNTQDGDNAFDAAAPDSTTVSVAALIPVNETVTAKLVHTQQSDAKMTGTSTGLGVNVNLVKGGHLFVEHNTNNEDSGLEDNQTNIGFTLKF